MHKVQNTPTTFNSWDAVLDARGSEACSHRNHQGHHAAASCLPGPTILHCNTPLHKPCKPCKPPGQAAHTQIVLVVLVSMYVLQRREVANCLPSAEIKPSSLSSDVEGGMPFTLKADIRKQSTLRQYNMPACNTPFQSAQSGPFGEGGVEAHRIVNTCQPWMRACCGAMGQSPCFFFFSLSGNYPRRIEPASIINQTQAHPCRSHAAPRKVEFRRAWRKNTDTLN